MEDLLKRIEDTIESCHTDGDTEVENVARLCTQVSELLGRTKATLERPPQLVTAATHFYLSQRDDMSIAYGAQSLDELKTVVNP